MSSVPADCSVLRRTRRTASQVGLSAAQRKRNVAAAFKVATGRRQAIQGKSIVGIDDVIHRRYIRDLRAGLKRAGAAWVDVLALVRAVEPAVFVL